jgi:raffinose/stachyose/melibiose transport system permease protein
MTALLPLADPAAAEAPAPSSAPPRGRRRPSGRLAARRGAPLVANIVVWAYAAFSAYPLLWLLLQTFRSDAQILGDPWGIPLRPSVEAYATAFSTTPLPQYFLNSLIVTLATVSLTVACCVGAGYAFSRLRFPGSTAVFTVFIGVLVIPAPVLLLPRFLISGELGILNSYIGLIAPFSAGALAVGTFLIKTHFDQIPDSLVEAAELDRATPWQVLRLVMLPQIGPAAATIGVLSFMGAWNEYIYSVVALRSPELFTLPVGIADIAAKQYLYGYAPVFAAMVVAALPVYLAFLLAQRFFLRAFALGGGVKG